MKKKFAPHEDLTLYSLITQALEQKYYTTKRSSYKEYSTTFGDLQNFLTNNSLDQIKVTDFTEVMAAAYMRTVKSKKKKDKTNICNVTKNKYLAQIKVLFNTFIESAYIDVNPFNRIKKSKEVKNLKKAFEPEVKDLIFTYLKEHDKRMYFACCFLYYGFMRPNELRQIQLFFINMRKRTIFLPKKITKTDFDRTIRISDPLYHILLDMNIGLHTPNSYLFGASLVTGEQVMPRADYFSKRWRKRLNQMKLPNHLEFYGNKYTGLQDHHEAGISIGQLSSQSGLTIEILQQYLECRKFPAKDQFCRDAPYLNTIDDNLLPLRRAKDFIESFEKFSEGEQKFILEKLTS